MELAELKKAGKFSFLQENTARGWETGNTACVLQKLNSILAVRAKAKSSGSRICCFILSNDETCLKPYVESQVYGELFNATETQMKS